MVEIYKRWTSYILATFKAVKGKFEKVTDGNRGFLLIYKEYPVQAQDFIYYNGENRP